MPSSLTGDFDAVLQVSGGTLARLLASMHQNSGPRADPSTPSFPHSVAIRVGDPQPVEGVSGSAYAQVGVPRMRLLDGSTDRFRIAVGVRARFVSDPGTERMPELIHGTLTAEYKLEPISPDCPGYRHTAGEFFWPRVVRDTVRFEGTATDDLTMLSVVAIDPVDEEEALRRITRICAVLLRTTFAPLPQRTSPQFRRGRMRSLDRGNETAVAIPLALDGGAPAGSIASVDRVVLAGADIGLAISADAVLARIQPRLDALRASFGYILHLTSTTQVLGFSVVDINISWRVSLTSAVVEWAGPPPLLGDETGVLVVRIKGQADTSDPSFDIGFDVTQFLSLSYDSGNERIVPSAIGGPVVSVQAGGTYGSLIRSFAKPEVEKQVGAQVTSLLSQAGSMLDLSGPRKDLVAQMQTLDAQADARLLDARFTSDGLVLRGPVRVAARRRSEISFATTAEENGFTALQAWLPGGRIDRLDWSWEWFNGGGDAGASSLEHTYLLRRPLEAPKGKFGGLFGLRRPLPGIDGMGRVCLTVSGVRVDSGTGALVPFTASQRCRRYGFDLRAPLDLSIDKYLVHEPFPGPGPGLVVDLLAPTIGLGLNVLVIGAGDLWDGTVGEQLKAGLEQSRRRDAGLLVLVLVSEGLLDAQLQAKIGELGRTLQAPLVASEDVGGAWATALRMHDDGGDLSWRLVTPTGGMSWRHRGELDSERLAHAIDVHLFATPVAKPSEIDPWIVPGTVIPPWVLDPSFATPADPRCPPVPVGRLAVSPSIVLFVRAGTTLDALKPLVAEYPDAVVALVVDGASDTGDLEELGEHVIPIADPDGVVARRLGVRTWPTTLMTDEPVTAVRSDAPPQPRGTRP